MNTMDTGALRLTDTEKLCEKFNIPIYLAKLVDRLITITGNRGFSTFAVKEYPESDLWYAVECYEDHKHRIKVPGAYLRKVLQNRSESRARSRMKKGTVREDGM